MLYCMTAVLKLKIGRTDSTQFSFTFKAPLARNRLTTCLKTNYFFIHTRILLKCKSILEK